MTKDLQPLYHRLVESFNNLCRSLKNIVSSKNNFSPPLTPNLTPNLASYHLSHLLSHPLSCLFILSCRLSGFHSNLTLSSPLTSSPTLPSHPLPLPCTCRPLLSPHLCHLPLLLSICFSISPSPLIHISILDSSWFSSSSYGTLQVLNTDNEWIQQCTDNFLGWNRGFDYSEPGESDDSCTRVQGQPWRLWVRKHTAHIYLSTWLLLSHVTIPLIAK